MKKLYYLLYMVAAVMIAACTHEEEDLFAESSAQRADATIKANLEVLTSPDNGWLMEYFPASQQEYGGYNLLLSFGKDGQVKVASEIAAADKTITSLYSVNQSAGIVLSFDTYNDIFHVFSDPSDPLGASSPGYGFEGDYDFLILEATAERVLLKGKKSGGYAVLTPMTGDWTEYITTIQEADEAMTFSKFKLELKGEEIPVKISDRTLTFTYTDAEGNEVSKTASYIVTPTGYKFYAPVEINGVSISEFKFDAAGEQFSEAGDATILLVPVWPSLNELLVSGQWFIAYSQLGTFAQPYFNVVKSALEGLGFTLSFAYIGTSVYGTGGLSYSFLCNTYYGALGFDYELIGEDKITMAFNWTGEGNGIYFYNNAKMYYALVPFGYSAPVTFTLTSDDNRNPTYITLTDDANPDNQITLSRGLIFNPFDY